MSDSEFQFSFVFSPTFSRFLSVLFRHRQCIDTNHHYQHRQHRRDLCITKLVEQTSGLRFILTGSSLYELVSIQSQFLNAFNRSSDSTVSHSITWHHSFDRLISLYIISVKSTLHGHSTSYQVRWAT